MKLCARVPGGLIVATLVTGNQLRCLYRNRLWPQVSSLLVTIGQRLSQLCHCSRAQVLLEMEERRGAGGRFLQGIGCLNCLPMAQLVMLCIGMAAWLELMSKSKGRGGGGGEERDQVKPGAGQSRLSFPLVN